MTRPARRGMALSPLLLLSLWTMCADQPGSTSDVQSGSPGSGLEADGGGELPSSETSPGDVMAGSGAGSGTVGYGLDWSWGKAKAAEGDAGWDVVTDQGYAVHISRGYLVTYSLQLVPCDELEHESGDAGDWFRELVGVGRAHAGHSAEGEDPSLLDTAWVEALVSPAAVGFGEVQPGVGTYCGVHYLMARSDDKGRNFPGDIDMLRKSLYLEGTWRAPGGTEDTPFTVFTTYANGVIAQPFEDHVDSTANDVNVVVTRDLGVWFDAIDFATANDNAVAWQIVKNIIAGTTVAATVVPVGGGGS